MLDLPPCSDFLRPATQRVFVTVIQESERQLKDLRLALNLSHASTISEAYTAFQCGLQKTVTVDNLIQDLGVCTPHTCGAREQLYEVGSLHIPVFM